MFLFKMWYFGHSFVKTNVMKSKSKVKDEEIKDFLKKKHLIPSTFPVQLFLILRMLCNNHFKIKHYLLPHLRI